MIRGGGDFLARIGGDEFAVLAPETNDADIQQLATRLEDRVPAGVSCSFGRATWDGVENEMGLMRNADQNMYDEKLRRRADEARRRRERSIVAEESTEGAPRDRF